MTKVKDYKYYVRQNIERMKQKLMELDENSDLYKSTKSEIHRQEHTLKMKKEEIDRYSSTMIYHFGTSIDSSFYVEVDDISI